jgi:hypothetical protein
MSTYNRTCYQHPEDRHVISFLYWFTFYWSASSVYYLKIPHGAQPAQGHVGRPFYAVSTIGGVYNSCCCQRRRHKTAPPIYPRVSWGQKLVAKSLAKELIRKIESMPFCVLYSTTETTKCGLYESTIKQNPNFSTDTFMQSLAHVLFSKT